MEALFFLASIASVHLLALMSPGPDFIMACKNALQYSRRTGIYTSVGFGLGIAVHIAYCLAGLAVIISQSILVFQIIKLLGAAYLIMIGIKSLRSKGGSIDVTVEKKGQDISAWTAIKMGFLTNVLNPKVTLFFLSVFSLMIEPNTASWVLAILSVMMVALTIAWFSFVSIVLTQEKVRCIFTRYQQKIDRVFGALLIALGLKVGLSK